MDNLNLHLLERQAEICKALGNPKRLQIIQVLGEGEMAAGDLANALNTTPANMSQHLSTMKQVGLVDSRREANNVFYCLTTPAIINACAIIKAILTEQVKREHELLERSIQ